MLKRRSLRKGGGDEPVAARRRARPPSRSAPAEPEAGEVPAQVRAPNRVERLGPLNEEELAALEVGWGFVE